MIIKKINSNITKEELIKIKRLIRKNIGYYMGKIITLEKEIINTKINPLWKGLGLNNEILISKIEIDKRWDNKLKSIKQKEKGLRRLYKIVRRLNRCLDYINKGDLEYINNIILKDL